jgi:hypothetical protein
MENAELNQLIDLLDNPSALNQKIVELKSSSNLNESTEGFITLFDLYHGDVQKIKDYLNDSKIQITRHQKKNTMFSAYFKYAAIILILIGVGCLFFLSNDKQIITLKNEFTEPGLSNYMSAESTANWVDIMFDYKTKNFKITDTKLEKALAIFPENDTLLYFSGVVKYDLKKLDQAKLKLLKIAHSNSTFKDRATYYLGRIAFEKGNRIEAEKLFKSLLNSNDIDVKNASFEHTIELKSK